MIKITHPVSLTEYIVAVMSFVAALIVSFYAFPEIHAPEILLGWGIAFVNHLADGHIKKISLEKNKEVVREVSVKNFFRFFALIICVYAAINFLGIHSFAFMYSLLLSYIVFMTFDLTVYYQRARQL